MDWQQQCGTGRTLGDSGTEQTQEPLVLLEGTGHSDPRLYDYYYYYYYIIYVWTDAVVVV